MIEQQLLKKEITLDEFVIKFDLLNQEDQVKIILNLLDDFDYDREIFEEEEEEYHYKIFLFLKSKRELLTLIRVNNLHEIV